MATPFDNLILEHIECLKAMASDTTLKSNTELAVQQIVNCYRNGGKVLLCGNGGSAADAEHLAGELSGRFNFERPPLFAEALHVNSAALTAISNDYNYEDAFARILESKAKPKDILIAISTSGKSKNILKVMEKANQLNVDIIAICGNNKSQMSDLAGLTLSIPSNITPRIQEAYLVLGHIICESVEKELFKN